MSGLSAGYLDSKAFVKYPVYSGRSTMGAQITSWVGTKFIWCHIRHQSGGVVEMSGDVYQSELVEITCRLNATITTHCRMVINGITYAVVDIDPYARDRMTVRLAKVETGVGSVETLDE